MGKTITLSCNINISSGKPRIAIGTCDSSGVNRAILNSKNIGSSGTYSVTATLPTSTTSTTKYMYIGLNISRDVAISVGDYSEFTNILLEENSIATNYTPHQILESSNILHGSSSLNIILNNLIGGNYPNADANTFTNTGVYYLTSGATNTPNNLQWCYLLVLKAPSHSDMVQIAIQIGGNYLYYRTRNGSTWSVWKKIQATAMS